MPRIIMLAVDGSPIALNAVRYAIECFGLPRNGYDVHLLHAQLRIPPRAASAVGREIVRSYYRTEAEEALRDARRMLDTRNVTYQIVRKIGHPATEIAQYACEHGVELIVMGSHGLGAAKGLLLGSVAQGVLASCDVPVLVVREGMEHRKGADVVIAVDGSPYARRAVAYLLRHHELLAGDASIVLIHVMERGHLALDIGAMLEEALRDAALNRVMQPARRLLEAARMKWQELQVEGDAGTEIAAQASRRGTGLIVMGSHGRGAMAGLLLGSVAQKTISAGAAPVLIVR